MSTVLIVDDNQVVLKMVSTNLQFDGYDTITAQNGKEGLEAALRDEPDVIVLDIMMPVMDGLEMLEELRKSSEVPVIILSAYGKPEIVGRARELGIECFINKPFEMEVLKDTIDIICA